MHIGIVHRLFIHHTIIDTIGHGKGDVVRALLNTPSTRLTACDGAVSIQRDCDGFYLLQVAMIIGDFMNQQLIGACYLICGKWLLGSDIRIGNRLAVIFKG